MRTFISIFFFLSFSYLVDSQQSLLGTWQGVVVQAGYEYTAGNLIYASFEGDVKSFNGHTREEVFNTDQFAVKIIKGSIKGNQIKFEQKVVEKTSKSSRTKWCRFNATLNYDQETGYLTGNYESTDCKRVIGKILMYRADFELSRTETAEVSHIWFEQFIKDYNAGLPAPEIRKKERDNFVFEPVFFDFDKAVIRSEHEEFLNRLIKVVKGHSDLRVKVVGHTDADGTDSYNDGLSKKRAEAIINYFVAHGLSEDRLEFDFKGEKNPIDTNSTPEGKQRNRRVDFQFI